MLPQVNIIRANNGDFLSFFEQKGISGVLTAFGAWDELTIALARTLVDITDLPPVIMDIGANMGTFTVPVAKHVAGRGGQVHSFEPQKIVFYQLCGNIFLNRLDNVWANNMALSSANEFREIPRMNFDTAWNIGAYSLVPDVDPQQKLETKDPCEFRKLDDLELAARITLIKLDVEGMEIEVLGGAMNRIAKDGFPPILFESLTQDPRSAEVKTLLTSAGYKLSQYADEDWLAQHGDWPVEIALVKGENGMSYGRLR
ncbi:FkbM family methyltransferase [Paraburkholderia acidisoli]|uniref:FkbM family methyltransferase n=1 Tax=Paraburkholderia acidisoli TaxID=2571748 RepID=A0A7Z2GF28_9BURK|nr:FkbM family methyltransferase [Paraburkholderia acidisoli]QGZ60493.1 FkbM family methyltransferase [Paraburkholderia acidisoli]